MPLATTITARKPEWGRHALLLTKQHCIFAVLSARCLPPDCSTPPVNAAKRSLPYRLSGEKVKLTAFFPLLKGVFQAMTFRELCRFARLMKRAGASLNDRYDKEKKPHIYVGLVCVTEKYQGQGYMRKVLEMAFADGNRLQVPVILETDAKSKCDKYVHLGMELAGTRDAGELGTLYDLIKYPDK